MQTCLQLSTTGLSFFSNTRLSECSQIVWNVFSKNGLAVRDASNALQLVKIKFFFTSLLFRFAPVERVRLWMRVLRVLAVIEITPGLAVLSFFDKESARRHLPDWGANLLAKRTKCGKHMYGGACSGDV